MSFVSKTRNCVLKTRNCVLQMMNFAVPAGQERLSDAFMTGTTHANNSAFCLHSVIFAYSHHHRTSTTALVGRQCRRRISIELQRSLAPGAQLLVLPRELTPEDCGGDYSEDSGEDCGEDCVAVPFASLSLPGLGIAPPFIAPCLVSTIHHLISHSVGCAAHSSRKPRKDRSDACVQPCCVGWEPLGAHPPSQIAGASCGHRSAWIVARGRCRRFMARPSWIVSYNRQPICKGPFLS